MAGLTRVSRITLFDRHHIEHPGATDLMGPYAFDVSYSGRLQSIEQQCRSHHCLRVRIIVRRLRRRAAYDDRIVAIVDTLNSNDWRRCRLAWVIAMKLAERTFNALITWVGPTFNH